MTEGTPVAEFALAELIDKIVAASLALQPLCNDSSKLPIEAQQVVKEVCAILQSAKADIVERLDPLASKRPISA
jgi:hypothetical protein